MKKRNIIFTFITIILIFFICAMFAEFSFRAYESYSKQSTLKLFIERPNDKGSYQLIQNQKLSTQISKQEIKININSHGMHWREVDIPKKTGVERIAFVGDSHAFGCWADCVEHSFVGIFDSAIASPQIEVLNFGVGGYGIDDIELHIRQFVLEFSPDYVILMFSNGNDIRDTYLGLNKYDVSSGQAIFNKNNLIAKLPQKLINPKYLDRSIRKKIISILRENSAAIRFLQKYIASRSIPESFADLHSLNVSPYFTSYSYWSQFPYSDLAIEATNQTIAKLEKINQILSANDSELIIATIPYPEQIYCRKKKGKSYDINLPQRFIKEFAVKNNVPYLDLLPVLRQQAEQSNSRLLVSGDPHFNNLGHAIIGEALADFYMHNIIH